MQQPQLPHSRQLPVITSFYLERDKLLENERREVKILPALSLFETRIDFHELRITRMRIRLTCTKVRRAMLTGACRADKLRLPWTRSRRSSIRNSGNGNQKSRMECVHW